MFVYKVLNLRLNHFYVDLQEHDNPDINFFSFRLANLCLVQMEEYEQAVGNYDEAIEQLEEAVQRTYLQIDREFAILHQLQNLRDDLDNVSDKSIRDLSEERFKNIRTFHAQLNGENTDISTDFSTPGTIELLNCYPNPFNSSTTLRYYLSGEAEINVQIFDINGRLVSDLFNSRMNGGFHTVSWDAKDMSNGIYFVNITSNDQSNILKISLIK